MSPPVVRVASQVTRKEKGHSPFIRGDHLGICGHTTHSDRLSTPSTSRHNVNTDLGRFRPLREQKKVGKFDEAAISDLDAVGGISPPSALAPPIEDAQVVIRPCR